MRHQPKLVNRYLEKAITVKSWYGFRVAEGSLKGRIYPQFARIAQALGSERRLELLDLLTQAPRHVEALASETGMSVANVSQLVTVSKELLTEKTGHLSPATLQRLDEGLRLVLSL